MANPNPNLCAIFGLNESKYFQNQKIARILWGTRKSWDHPETTEEFFQIQCSLYPFCSAFFSRLDAYFELEEKLLCGAKLTADSRQQLDDMLRDGEAGTPEDKLRDGRCREARGGARVDERSLVWVQIQLFADAKSAIATGIHKPAKDLFY